MERIARRALLLVIPVLALVASPLSAQTTFTVDAVTQICGSPTGLTINAAVGDRVDVSNTQTTCGSGNVTPWSSLWTFNFVPNGPDFIFRVDIDEPGDRTVTFTGGRPARIIASGFRVGGGISGLPPSTSVSLALNGGGAGGTISSVVNSPFQFGRFLAPGASYSVTVTAQPSGATCVVANATGTIGSSDVNNANVTCSSVPGPGIGLETSSPARYAEEINASPSAEVTLANVGDALNLSSPLGYSFTQSEVRHARVECPAHVRFAAGTTVATDDPAAGVLGSVNGIGTNAITFSVTASTSSLTASDRLIVTGNRIITSAEDAVCSLALYDFPSQAQAGGPAGRVVLREGPYLDFAPSYALRVEATGRATADVDAVDGPFLGFVAVAPTNSDELGALGRFSYGTVADVLGEVQPLKPDGTPITLTDLMGPDTALVFGGDFSPAAEVFLSANGQCTALALSASGNDGNAATFTIGDLAFIDHTLCYRAGSTEIQPLETGVELQPVAASAAYAVTTRGPEALGVIDRNGTELQAPLVQMPEGSLPRIVLTNTGTEKRAFRMQLFGSTSGSAAETSTDYVGINTFDGVLPVDGALVVNLSDAFPRERFTGPARGFVRVIIDGPTGQIQGVYQIVNPANGTISNHVMVRPGKN